MRVNTKKYTFEHGKVYRFALLRRTERPPNRQNLNYSLGKSTIGVKSMGAWETGN